MRDLSAIFLLLIVIAPRSEGLTLDEIIEAAGIRPQGVAQTKNPGLQNDGQTIVELDILLPPPCERKSNESENIQVVDQSEDAPDACPAEDESSGNGQVRKKRNAIEFESLRWTNGIVPYKIAPGFFSSELGVLREAIDAFDRHTCVSLVEKAENDNVLPYVNIFRGTGCFSNIGKRSSNTVPNQLSLGNGCLRQGGGQVAIHEFMHTLGILHEQSRPDRNSFVQIHLENVEDGFENNFNSRSSAVTFTTEYDYTSVMHYGRKFFSKNGLDTITTIPAGREGIIGSARFFSFEDLQDIHSMHSCNSVCGDSITCPAGSYLANDCECHCKKQVAVGSRDVPAEICQLCRAYEVDCDCENALGGCEALPQTTCNPTTKACECINDHVFHNLLCRRTDDIPCDSIGEDCKCSLQSDSPCSGFQNARCDDSSNACICDLGFVHEPNSGTCKDDGACNLIDLPCDCEDVSGACDDLSQTSCNVNSKACECTGDLIVHNNECVSANSIPCTAIDVDCKCDSQDDSPCAGLDNSNCDDNTHACVCKSGYQLNPATGNCDEITPCRAAMVPCDCTDKSGSCNGILNSDCSQSSKACECNSASILHNELCPIPNSIPCTAIDVDCKCDSQDDSPCAGLDNSNCDTNTHACVCNSGYQLNPATGNCAEITPCTTAMVSCDCTDKSGSCSDIPNSDCILSSKACECNSASILHNGLCPIANDIECTEINQDCKCSEQSDAPCAMLANSTCSDTTDSCICNTGFVLNMATGVCTDTTTVKKCRRPNTECGCSMKDDACGLIFNSTCDQNTNECVCLSDFYQDRRICRKLPEPCTRLDDRTCRCRDQATPCSGIPNSECKERRGCHCKRFYRAVNDKCIPKGRNILFISNGRRVRPFRKPESTFAFKSSRGNEPANGDQAPVKIPLNGKILQTSNQAPGTAILETPGLRPGTWCLQFYFQLDFSALDLRASVDNRKTWQTLLSMQAGWRTGYQLFDRRISSGGIFYLRLRARQFPSNLQGHWEVNIDPLVLKRC